MAKKPDRLAILIATKAQRELNSIWEWNVEAYGPDHADRYIAFLLTEIEKLGLHYSSGHPVPVRSSLQFLVVKRRKRGHGHILVYQVGGQQVELLHCFHTAQNWQESLRDEEEDS